MPKSCLTNHIPSKPSKIYKVQHTQRTIVEQEYKCHLVISTDNSNYTKNYDSRTLEPTHERPNELLLQI